MSRTTLTSLYHDLDILNLRSLALPSLEHQAFLSYHGLDFDYYSYQAGMVYSPGAELFVQVFRQAPQRSRGNLYLSHGYLEHGSVNANAIRFFYDLGFTVVVWDLRGHGLSSGRRASIDSFTDYGSDLASVIDWVQESLPGPITLVGFSTGGAVTLDYMLRGSREVDRVILLAPIIRSVLWEASQVAFGLAEILTDTVPRQVSGASRSRDYQRFMVEGDVMQINAVPIAWFQAVAAWKDRFYVQESHLQGAPPLLVLQGEADGVVDYPYNIPEIFRVFPHAEIRYFPDAHHVLFHEPEPTRRELYYLMERFLNRLDPEGEVTRLDWEIFQRRIQEVL